VIAFFFAAENVLFSAAICLMLLIGVLEGVGTLLGAGISHMLDSLVPDIDMDAPDVAAGGGLSGFLGWLCVGRVPLLILLVTFLTVFGIAGLVMQSVAAHALGTPLPGALVALPAFAAALPGTRWLGSAFARFMPHEETYAVSRNSFVGRVAVLTQGRADQTLAAEARLKDAHGRTHYVRVAADVAGETFDQGEQVLLVRNDGALFRVIRAGGALADPPRHHP